MASATYDSVKAVRAAIGARRLETTGGRASPRIGAPARGGRASEDDRPGSPGFPWMRGLWASLVIAAGYVACVSALRWLISAL